MKTPALPLLGMFMFTNAVISQMTYGSEITGNLVLPILSPHPSDETRINGLEKHLPEDDDVLQATLVKIIAPSTPRF